MKEENNHSLPDRDALKLVLDAFRLIAEYHSILEVKEFAKTETGKKADKNWERKYPRITFSITKDEILALQESSVIQEDFNLSDEFGSKLLDPLTKLLYAVVWKNGDLKKIKHIVKGVADSIDKNDQEDALVFYNFGKHLTREAGNPIIDQHVLRAFELYHSKDAAKIPIGEIRRNDKCDNKELINAYKAWWLKTVDHKINGNMEHAYQIDKLLFEVGKLIKIGKKSGDIDI